jgi:hypothetical protein
MFGFEAMDFLQMDAYGSQSEASKLNDQLYRNGALSKV